MSDVLRIEMQSRAVPLEAKGNHVHTCPLCYEHVPCAQECAVEPDLTLDDGTLRGHYVACAKCVPARDANGGPISAADWEGMVEKANYHQVSATKAWSNLRAYKAETRGELARLRKEVDFYRREGESHRAVMVHAKLDVEGWETGCDGAGAWATLSKIKDRLREELEKPPAADDPRTPRTQPAQPEKGGQ